MSQWEKPPVIKVAGQDVGWTTVITVGLVQR